MFLFYLFSFFGLGYRIRRKRGCNAISVSWPCLRHCCEWYSSWYESVQIFYLSLEMSIPVRVLDSFSVVIPKLFPVHMFVIAVNGRQVDVNLFSFFSYFCVCFVAADVDSGNGVYSDSGSTPKLFPVNVFAIAVHGRQVDVHLCRVFFFIFVLLLEMSIPVIGFIFCYPL